jgi:hypothetical protein
MKSAFFVVAALLFTACFTPEGNIATDLNLSTEEHELSTCTAYCSNGTSISCTSPSYCYSDADSAHCVTNSGGWQNIYCEGPDPYCGDGICNNGENWQTCSDCPAPPYCGDGICNNGENWQTCGDCSAPQPVCGDGICNGNEGWWNCSDCPPCEPGCHIP